MKRLLLGLVVIGILMGCDSKAERERQAAAQRLADSVFVWTIAENPDTVSRSTADSTIAIFKKRGWDIPDNFRKCWIDLRLAWVDTLFHNAKTQTECENANQALNEVLDYEPLSQSQRSKFEGLKNRLNYKTKVLIAKEKEKLAKEEKLAAEKERLAKIEARKEFADKLEYIYLDKGMDVTVTVSGSDATTLKIKWILISRVTAHEFGQDTELLQLLRECGFKKLILTDGYNATWRLDLERNVWI